MLIAASSEDTAGKNTNTSLVIGASTIGAVIVVAFLGLLIFKKTRKSKPADLDGGTRTTNPNTGSPASQDDDVAVQPDSMNATQVAMPAINDDSSAPLADATLLQDGSTAPPADAPPRLGFKHQGDDFPGESTVHDPERGPPRYDLASREDDSRPVPVEDDHDSIMTE